MLRSQLLFCLSSLLALAQPQQSEPLRISAERAKPPLPMTLQETVDAAVRQYPSISAAREQAAAAASAIQLARTAFLPKADAIAGVNRATRNNSFGLLLPSQIIAPISGPALGSNSASNVWGSTAGFLVSWEPFDFGLRRANIAVAEAGKQRAELALERTRFELAHLTADTYLTLLAAEQAVEAAQSGFLRAQKNEGIVSAIVKADLRPGADLSRAQAETALAMSMLIQTEQARDLARVALSQLTGQRTGTNAQKLLAAAPQTSYKKVPVDAHPRAREQQTAIDEIRSRQSVLDKSYVPKFQMQGTTYARGTGDYDPLRGALNAGNFASGLGPNIVNWAIGFTISFPIFELPAIKARKEAESHRELAEKAKLDQTVRELEAGRERADAILLGAQRLVATIPAQINAARQGREQAVARYQAGLATIVEVTDAERLLTQAEIDEKLANLNIWRALLRVAAASGDLEPFLVQTR